MNLIEPSIIHLEAFDAVADTRKWVFYGARQQQCNALVHSIGLACFVQTHKDRARGAGDDLKNATYPGGH